MSKIGKVIFEFGDFQIKEKLDEDCITPIGCKLCIGGEGCGYVGTVTELLDKIDQAAMSS